MTGDEAGNNEELHEQISDSDTTLVLSAPLIQAWTNLRLAVGRVGCCCRQSDGSQVKDPAVLFVSRRDADEANRVWRRCDSTMNGGRRRRIGGGRAFAQNLSPRLIPPSGTADVACSWGPVASLSERDDVGGGKLLELVTGVIGGRIDVGVEPDDGPSRPGLTTNFGSMLVAALLCRHNLSAR